MFICGGTIDKAYFPGREQFDFAETHIFEMLAQARIPDDLIVPKVLFHKDSADMIDADRECIAEACNTSESRRILVAHGTSTMVETARHLAQKTSGKAIILFGAMLPCELKFSDALFNLGYAVAAVQLLPPGVYIAMNGQVWRHDAVRKNVFTATFEGFPK